MTRALTAFAPLASLVIAAVVMGSWLDNTHNVIQGCDGCISMKPTTAMCLGFASVAVAMLRLGYDRVAATFAGLTLAGIWTVLVYVTLGIDLRLETWALPDTTLSMYQTTPGMPSVGSLTGFTIAALATMWRATVGHGSTQLPGIAVAGIGAVAILGYACNIPRLYWWADGVSNAIAISTALGFVALGMGLAGVREVSHDRDPVA